MYLLTSGSRLGPSNTHEMTRDGEEVILVQVKFSTPSIVQHSNHRRILVLESTDRFSSAMHSRMSRQFTPTMTPPRGPPPPPVPPDLHDLPMPRYPLSNANQSTSGSQLRTYGSLADLAESAFEVNEFMMKRCRAHVGRPHSAAFSPSTTISSIAEGHPTFYAISPSFASNTHMYHAN